MTVETSAHAIVVQDISKSFGEIQALSGVSFVVPRGTVFCLLGPNGAGKTTLLRILTTVTRPNGGSAWVEGFNIQAEALEARKCFGVVAQENRFDRYLNIWENLMLHARMHDLARPEAEARITALLNQVDLYHRRFSLADDLSGGMQRRIALVRALIHQPKVLFLDEPTTGLDPEARLEIWHAIEGIKSVGTVILTTHYMEEADRLSDRILMLHHGQVVMEGTPRELKQQVSPLDKYELALSTPTAAECLAVLKTLSGVYHPEMKDAYCLMFGVDSPAALQQVMNTLDPTNFQRLGRVEADLEDVFLAVATAHAAGKAAP